MKLKTRDLFIKTLEQMGCEYYVDDDEICFRWQGGQFCASVKNDKLDVIIWYYWAEMEVRDTVSIQQWKDIVNNANGQFISKAVYTIDEEENVFCIYNEASFQLHPQITDKEMVVRTILERLFILRRFIEKEFDVEYRKNRPMHEIDKEFPFIISPAKWVN